MDDLLVWAAMVDTTADARRLLRSSGVRSRDAKRNAPAFLRYLQNYRRQELLKIACIASTLLSSSYLNSTGGWP